MIPANVFPQRNDAKISPQSEVNQGGGLAPALLDQSPEFNQYLSIASGDGNKSSGDLSETGSLNEDLSSDRAGKSSPDFLGEALIQFAPHNVPQSPVSHADGTFEARAPDVAGIPDHQRSPLSDRDGSATEAGRSSDVNQDLLGLGEATDRIEGRSGWRAFQRSTANEGVTSRDGVPNASTSGVDVSDPSLLISSIASEADPAKGSSGIRESYVHDPFSDPAIQVESFKTGSQAGVESLSRDLRVLDKVSGSPAAVSTEDFLSLRNLRKEKGVRGSPSQPDGLTFESPHKGNLHLGPVVEAPVTTGTAGKTILSHDAIHEISRQVNLLGAARQDGEIKIRLKPDHLGELVMNVKSKGNEVSIQIKTHDLEAKKIIEESIGRLKESLSVQNLSLSSLDVTNQSIPIQGTDQFMQSEFRQNQNSFGSGNSGQWDGSGSGTRQEFLYEEEPGSATLKSLSTVRGGRPSGTGTLDLIA